MSAKLFLHIGTQKTGSSFLQHMLRKNWLFLQERGFAYRGFSEEYISSGNGDALIAAVKSAQALGDFRKTLDGYFAGKSAAIISSEILYSTGLSPDGPGWQFLLRRLQECEVQVEVIAFFRNPVDYLRSAYSQSVRRHGFTEDFAHYVDAFPTDLYDGPLRQLVAASELPTSQARLHVLDYDSSTRGGLWAVFLEICGLNSSEFLDEQVSVNQSLNASQLLLHRIYNTLRPDDTSGFFSDLLIGSGILADAAPLGVTEGEFTSIQRRFSTAVEFVNRFVSGGPVSLSPPPSFWDGSGDLTMHGDDVSRLMQGLFSEMSPRRVLSRGLAQIVEQCKDADPQLKRRYPEFDPVTYLVCNPDLIEAKVDPYWHYDNHGRREGRRHTIGD